jgi:osmotically-inducible protein OsmY
MSQQATKADAPILSPSRIGRVAESRLRNSPYAALRTVSCEFHEGVLVLRGRLPTYYLKQIAQASVVDLDGVAGVANQIEVVRPGPAVTALSPETVNPTAGSWF